MSPKRRGSTRPVCIALAPYDRIAALAPFSTFAPVGIGLYTTLEICYLLTNVNIRRRGGDKGMVWRFRVILANSEHYECFASRSACL